MRTGPPSTAINLPVYSANGLRLPAHYPKRASMRLAAQVELRHSSAGNHSLRNIGPSCGSVSKFLGLRPQDLAGGKSSKQLITIANMTGQITINKCYM